MDRHASLKKQSNSVSGTSSSQAAGISGCQAFLGILIDDLEVPIGNAIDWVSRYRPQSFNEKCGLLLSASPSMVGGNWGLWALRVPLEHLGARVFPDMFSLAQAHKAFDAQGGIANPQLGRRFDLTITAFMNLVEAAKHYPFVKKAWFEFLGENSEAATERNE